MYIYRAYLGKRICVTVLGQNKRITGNSLLKRRHLNDALNVVQTDNSATDLIMHVMGVF